VTGFVKRGHPNYQLWQFITSDWKELLLWNLTSSEHQHRLIGAENCRLACLLRIKLWSSKFIELDVCRRQLFANPVTSRHTVVCRTAQEAVASPREYIDRKTKNVISHLRSSEITYPNSIKLAAEMPHN